jgi:hypothetical protein
VTGRAEGPSLPSARPLPTWACVIPGPSWPPARQFVADDLGAWLIFILAGAGRKKLTALVLGDNQERALRSAATAAVQRTASELRPGDAGQAEHVALVISQVFSEPTTSAPLAAMELVMCSSAVWPCGGEVGRRRGARGSGPFLINGPFPNRTGGLSPHPALHCSISGWWLWPFRRGCHDGSRPTPGTTTITGRTSPGSSGHPIMTGRSSCRLTRRCGAGRCSAA